MTPSADIAGRLTVTAGDWSLDLAPALGGSIVALRHHGHDILRPTPPGADHVLQTSCFPMLPFAGRIAQGRFSFAGRTVTLAPNLPGDPHCLHGLAWLAPWQVTAATPGRVRLTWQCDGEGAWPWAHEAEQCFALHASGLSIVLAVTNRSDTAMPVGLGFHPYFPASAGTGLCFAAQRVWLADPTLLPDRPAAHDALGDWRHGAPLPTTRLIDNSYEGWSGSAQIAGPCPLVLRARGARDLHLYAPAGAAFFCPEPVTHLPDAFNRGDRFDILTTGQRRAIAMSLTLAAGAGPSDGGAA